MLNEMMFCYLFERKGAMFDKLWARIASKQTVTEEDIVAS